MSYILEALRKSETERKQGGMPDLGSSVQIIHKPRKSGSSLLLWLMIVALLVNAGVLAWLFWPRALAPLAVDVPKPGMSQAPSPQEQVPKPNKNFALEAPLAPLPEDSAGAQGAALTQSEAYGEDWVVDPDQEVWSPATPAIETPIQRAGAGSSRTDTADKADNEASIAVPTLGTMPAHFQRRVPDLVFNSHIYSSNPSARRIMINGQYLREGKTFQGMVVEEITEDGVIFNLLGESFVVSVVRDWNAPR